MLVIDAPCLQYVIPSVVYPKAVRSTMTGFSAATGKLGAVAGAYIFGAVASATNFPTVMILCACLSLVGIVITHYFIVEPEDDDLRDDPQYEDTKIPNDSQSKSLISNDC